MDMPAAETQPPLTLSQKTLALLSVGLIGVGVVSLLPAALSCMILDAPGSEQRLAPVTLMFSILSFPIACFYAARKAITQLRRDRLRAGYFWLLLPIYVRCDPLPAGVTGRCSCGSSEASTPLLASMARLASTSA